MQEYPKGLVKDGEWVIVKDEAEESKARDDGFAPVGGEEVKERKKPGPKPKQ